MAGPTKKARKPSNPESGAEGSDSDDNTGSYHGQQEIQATFEGRNPEGQDFHGIKQLLQQLFLTAHIDLSQMSDMLIAQVGVGSVLKQSYNDSDDEEDVDMVEESDVFGITSVVNLTSHKETPCVQQLYQLLEETSKKHADNDTTNKITQVISQCSKLGFLINERFVNIPARISSAMLGSLIDELRRMKKKDNSYDFEYFVMISKTLKPKGQEKDGEVLFTNDEEELFLKNSECSYEFSVADQSDTALTGSWQSDDKEMMPFRTVMLFKANKLDNIFSQVKILVE